MARRPIPGDRVIRFPDGNHYRVADDVSSVTLDWDIGTDPLYRVEMAPAEERSIEDLVKSGYIVPIGHDDETDDGNE